MVCLRCKMLVETTLDHLAIPYEVIELGRISTTGILSADQLQNLKISLSKSGLELLHNKKDILVEKIKIAVIEMVHYSDLRLKTNFSNFLSAKLNLDYTYLANIFSEVQGTTIEQFIILHKIYKVKELIRYSELNLTEISYILHYSSVAHLSNQFKKVTGFTPSLFKQMEKQHQDGLENV
jgi:AraC-like DNA-binding protein